MKALRVLVIAIVLISTGSGVATAGKLKNASTKLNTVIVEQKSGKVIVGFEKKI